MRARPDHQTPDRSDRRLITISKPSDNRRGRREYSPGISSFTADRLVHFLRECASLISLSVVSLDQHRARR